MLKTKRGAAALPRAKRSPRLVCRQCGRTVHRPPSGNVQECWQCGNRYLEVVQDDTGPGALPAGSEGE